MNTANSSLSPETFRDVIGHFASGVTVITTVADDARYGTTASAMSSLSLEPPMVLVCLNRQSSTRGAVAVSGAFAVNILREDQGELAVRFASRGADRFAGLQVRTSPLGQPLLEDALATLECRVTERIEAATHTIFLGEVQDAQARPGTPLAYFRGRFGRLQLTADQAAYGQLRTWLLRGALPDGHLLTAGGLADELSANTASVLHGLSQLASEGLVDSRPDGDYVVRVASDDAVKDLYRARETIERGVAQATVGHVSPDAIAVLRGLAEATADATGDGRLTDIDSWVTANRAFHEFMVGLADSPALLHAHRGLGLTKVDVQRLFFGQRVDVLIDDHRRLVAAYEEGNVELACATIAAHARRPFELGSRGSAVPSPRPRLSSGGSPSIIV